MTGIWKRSGCTILLMTACSCVCLADTGWFIEGHVGWVDSDTDNHYFETVVERSGAANVRVDTDGKRSAIGLGLGYQATEILAFELRYLDLGEGDISLDANVANVNDVESIVSDVKPDSAAGLALGVTARAPLGDSWGLEGSLGVFRWDGDWDVKLSTGQSVNVEDSGADIYFGVGGYFYVNDKISLSLNWQRFDLPLETDVASLSVRYAF